MKFKDIPVGVEFCDEESRTVFRKINEDVCGNTTVNAERVENGAQAFIEPNDEVTITRGVEPRK